MSSEERLRLWQLFYLLWGKSLGEPSYTEEDWIELDRLLTELVYPKKEIGHGNPIGPT